MLNIKGQMVKTLVALSLFTATGAQAANLCNQVWTGNVERLRAQLQSNDESMVRLYLHPGNNADYAGYTASDFMVEVLMKAKDNDTQVTGYTDDKCVIKWVDLR